MYSVEYGTRKCPSCGASVQGLQGECPYCGSAFEKTDAKSPIERLAEAVEKATRECKERYAKSSVEMEKAKAVTKRKTSIWDENQIEDDTDEVVAGIIKNFPVPNSKADLMEFIIALKPKTQGSFPDGIKDAYYTKYKESLDKARYLYSDDRDVKRLLEANELKGLKKLAPSGRFWIYYAIGMAGLFLLLGIMALLFD